MSKNGWDSPRRRRLPSFPWTDSFGNNYRPCEIVPISPQWSVVTIADYCFCKHEPLFLWLHRDVTTIPYRVMDGMVEENGTSGSVEALVSQGSGNPIVVTSVRNSDTALEMHFSVSSVPTYLFAFRPYVQKHLPFDRCTLSSKRTNSLWSRPPRKALCSPKAT